jgi:hypothetical protein
MEVPMPPNSDVTKPLPLWHWVDSCDPQWGLLPTKEPLTPEFKDKVREDLKDYYQYWRRDQKFREYVRVFTNNSPGLTLSDIDPKYLFDNPFYLRMFCNKATTLYWSYSVMPKYPNPLVTIETLSSFKSSLQNFTSCPRCLGYRNGSPPAKLTFRIPASRRSVRAFLASSRGAR